MDLCKGSPVPLKASPGSIWTHPAHWLQNGSQLVLVEIPPAAQAAVECNQVGNRTLQVAWVQMDASTGQVVVRAQHPLFMQTWCPEGLTSLGNDTIVFNLAADTVAVMDMASLAILWTFGGPHVPAQIQPPFILQVRYANFQTHAWLSME